MWSNAGVLSTIGNTPLVELTRVLGDCRFRLFAKLEGFNPGGSIKDRPALRIIQKALEAGQIHPNTVIIESSSGNLGIGLAQTCLYLGLRFICVIDPKTTQQNRRLLEAYGAELNMVTESDPATGEFLQARLDRVRRLLNSFDNAFWPNQYANLYNAEAHHRRMEEIVHSLHGELDYLFCSTSTCGTLRGCAEYVRNNSLRIKLFAVDAVGSVIFGSAGAKRLIPGHGSYVRPALYEENLADKCIHVTDEECIAGCRALLSREALLVGCSSGGTRMAVKRMKDQIPPGATVAMIFPDRGERYFDTIFSDQWVLEHFGSLGETDDREISNKRVWIPVTASAPSNSVEPQKSGAGHVRNSVSSREGENGVNGKSFLTVENLGPEALNHLVTQALKLDKANGSQSNLLRGKIVGIYFRVSSTRTRTAFTVAAMRLGAQVIQYGPVDLQLATGETPHDTGRVLSQYLDALVVRTNQPLSEMKEIADQGRMSVINAMSDNEHPTQAIADLVTIYEALRRLNDVHILYIGEGNNTAAALALAISQFPGMTLTIVSPPGYGLPDELTRKCSNIASKNGSSIELRDNMRDLPTEVDVVYTTRWLTMGVPKQDLTWRDKFTAFQITPEVMKRVSKGRETIFLHDLPAMRDCEVVDEVLDGPQSIAFRQAYHKQSSAMAILEWCTTSR